MTPIITIPALPCQNMSATLTFWTTLGFQITYQQLAPNAYAVIQTSGYALHFFGLSHLPPQDNFSTCLVLVPEVEALHKQFADLLREHLGKVPQAGFPRLSRMRVGQTRFTVTDPAGNSVIFIRHNTQNEDQAAADAYREPGLTSLQRALRLAARLRDFKGDDAAAAKVLDLALKRQAAGLPEAELPETIKEALLARIELASALNDQTSVNRLTAELGSLT